MSFREDLEKWLQDCSKLVILGIGNPLRGDDAVGIRILRLLRGRVPRNVKLIEGGMVPENFIGKIKLFNPSHILLIDAADFGGQPGEVRLISPERIVGITLSTHALPLHVIAELINATISAKIMLFGIQPKNLNLGEEVSPEIKVAIRESAETILEVLSKIVRP